MMKDQRQKVLIVGLDGATFDVICPLVTAGRMPNVGSLMTTGTHGILRSTIPPITPTAWTSFMTGVNPGKHGIYDFQRAVPGSHEFRPVPAGQHEYKSIWRLASEAGKAVVSLDVPFTYPPEVINGCLISGYGTPVSEDVDFTWPRGLAQELREEFGECRPAVLEQLPNRTAEFFREWDRLLVNRVAIAHYLWSRVDWDLFMIVLGVTDNVQHVLWNYLDPRHQDYYAPHATEYREILYGYYEKADAFLGTLLDRVDDDTTVLIMSDHGFGSTRPGLFLPQLLMDMNMLHYRGGSRATQRSSGLMRSLLKYYNSVPWLRRLLLRTSSRYKTALKHLLEKGALIPSLENIDWAHTRAFPTAFGLHIYVNRADRYPEGIVHPGEEYKQLLEQLRRSLLAVTEPVTGEPIIRAVYRGDETYQGKWFESAPDLIVEYTNFFNPDREPNPANTLSGIGGSHVPEGIVVAAGSAIRGGIVEGAQIEDLAPTILHLLGLSVPSDMDGRVLHEILADEWIDSHPAVYDGSARRESVEEHEYAYSKAEVEQVREQLSGLGYL